MTKKPTPKPAAGTKATDPLADTDEYLAKWAKALVKAGKRDARLVLADYQALASNRELDKTDRDAARKRAKILSRFL